MRIEKDKPYSTLHTVQVLPRKRNTHRKGKKIINDDDDAAEGKKWMRIKLSENYYIPPTIL